MPETDAASELHRIVANAHDISMSTRDRYLRDVDRWIAFAGSDPTGWTRRRAADFYNKLLTEMKPQSANRLMAGIAYASRWWAHYENNPALDFARVQAAKPRDQKTQAALSDDEALKLLGACDRSPRGERDFALITTGLETGMRRISLIGMTIEDTLFSASPRTIYPATFVPLKGRRPAWVPLSDAAVQALQPWLRLLAAHGVHEGPVFRPLRAGLGREEDALGVLRRSVRVASGPLSRSAIAKLLDDRAKIAGLRHLNPHLFRHTFVTWRTNQRLQPHEIAAITHHDITKAIGALGGYMDAREIGGRVRNATPPWLAELVRQRIGGSND